MAEPRSVLRLRTGAWIVGTLTAALYGAYLAYPLLNTHFASYDDEGYMLAILGGTSSGGDLYDQVFSQYGPFFNEFYNGLFWLLRLPFDHDAGRAVTVAGWVLLSGVTGVATARATRSYAVGFTVQVVAFLSMTWVANEPLHPVLLTSLVLAAIFLASTILHDGARVPALAVGGLLGCLTLVKINVGLMALVAIMVAMLFARGRAAEPRLLSWGVAATFVLLPLVLMARDLGTMLGFAILVSCASVSVLLAAVQGRSRQPCPFPVDLVFPLLAGFAGSASIVCCLSLLRGTSPNGLLRGVLLDPLHHSDVFSIPLKVPVLAVAVGIAGTGLVAFLGHRQRTDPSARLVTGLVRLAGALVITLTVLRSWGGDPIAYALPFVGLAALPPYGTGQSIRRLGLPALAVMASLHAYPVAGSQLGAASFLFLPVAGVCAVDAARDLSHWAARQPRRQLLCGSAAAGAALLAAVYAGFPPTRQFDDAWTTYRALPSLGLPGAERVHLDAVTVRHYQDLALGLQTSCSTFYGLPGQNSLYIFSGLPQVTGYNATAWMFLFDDRQQTQIARALGSDPRSCVVRDDPLSAGWQRGRPLPRGPIVELIEAEFVLARSLGSSQLLVHRSR